MTCVSVARKHACTGIPSIGGLKASRSSPYFSSIRRTSNATNAVFGASSRTAIVTGASRGIGRAIAIRLAEDGYNVCINDVPNNEKEAHEVAEVVRGVGRKSLVIPADVSKRQQVTAMIQEVTSSLGPLHTMVANAGIVQIKPAIEVTEEDMERIFAVNVIGLHNCYVEAAKQMIAQGPPPMHPPAEKGYAGVPMTSKGVYKIIGAASIAAFRPAMLHSHYNASKWAVRGLTQCFALELAQKGITVNAYAPGIVGTKMWEKIDDELVKMKGGEKGDYLKQASEDLVALGRTSVAEDVAGVVHFLASPESDYMTGQTLVVDGGIVFT